MIIIVTMHFFYGFKNNFFKSELLIPILIENLKKKDRYLLCKCYIENNNWKFKILDKKIRR